VGCAEEEVIDGVRPANKTLGSNVVTDTVFCLWQKDLPSMAKRGRIGDVLREVAKQIVSDLDATRMGYETLGEALRIGRASLIVMGHDLRSHREQAAKPPLPSACAARPRSTHPPIPPRSL